MKSSNTTQNFHSNLEQNGARVAIPKTTVIKKQLLVFNNSGEGKLIAILRISNPTVNSDVFYKLNSDRHKDSFQVKSWKGRVRKNSHVDLTISTNLASNIKQREAQSTLSKNDSLSLVQLCQTHFNLEMTEYTSRWRNGQNSNRSSQNLMVKIELYCVTREVLLKVQDERKLNIDDFFLTCDDIQQYFAKYVEAAELESDAEKSQSELHESNLSQDIEIEQFAIEATAQSEPEHRSSDTEMDSVQSVTTKPADDQVPMKKQINVSSVLLVLLMLLLSIVMQLFSASFFYSKQLACKIANQFGAKQALDNSPEKERDKEFE